jgi:hypothetical protein
MGLPPPRTLSLSQALAFVVEHSGAGESEAREWLEDKGREGLIEASGLLARNASPNRAVRAAHPVRDLVPVSAAAWSQPDWTTGDLGLFMDVRISAEGLRLALGVKATLTPTRHPGPHRAAELERWCADWVKDKGRPPSLADMITQFAAQRRLSRQWVRDTARTLPAALRLKGGGQKRKTAG